MRCMTTAADAEVCVLGLEKNACESSSNILRGTPLDLFGFDPCEADDRKMVLCSTFPTSLSPLAGQVGLVPRLGSGGVSSPS